MVTASNIVIYLKFIDPPPINPNYNHSTSSHCVCICMSPRLLLLLLRWKVWRLNFTLHSRPRKEEFHYNPLIRLSVFSTHTTICWWAIIFDFLEQFVIAWQNSTLYRRHHPLTPAKLSVFILCGKAPKLLLGVSLPDRIKRNDSRKRIRWPWRGILHQPLASPHIDNDGREKVTESVQTKWECRVDL